MKPVFVAQNPAEAHLGWEQPVSPKEFVLRSDRFDNGRVELKGT